MIRPKIVTAAVCVALGALAVAAPFCLAGDRAAPPKPQARVIGHLELQSRRITLKSGGLFTIRTKDGRVLAENATLAQVRALDPLLQEKLERIMAGRGAGGTVWAGR